jgi:hypothetical protein
MPSTDHCSVDKKETGKIDGFRACFIAVVVCGKKAQLRSRNRLYFLLDRASDFDAPGACLPDNTLIA